MDEAVRVKEEAKGSAEEDVAISKTRAKRKSNDAGNLGHGDGDVEISR